MKTTTIVEKEKDIAYRQTLRNKLQVFMNVTGISLSSRSRLVVLKMLKPIT